MRGVLVECRSYKASYCNAGAEHSTAGAWRDASTARSPGVVLSACSEPWHSARLAPSIPSCMYHTYAPSAEHNRRSVQLKAWG